MLIVDLVFGDIRGVGDLGIMVAFDALGYVPAVRPHPALEL